MVILKNEVVKLDVKDLQTQDRPRERLLSLGASSLSDVELLAILIGSGSRGGGVFDIAAEVLNTYSLSDLRDMDYSKISKIPGIKQAKACQLLACFEVARRASKWKKDGAVLEKAEDIYQFTYDEFYLESSEIVLALFLDCKLHLIDKLKHKGDTSHSANIPLRAILTKALNCRAYAIILVHNHPSGDTTPSQADIAVTYEICQLLAKLDVVLLDHLIVSDTSYYSFAQHGLLSSPDEYSELGENDEEDTFKRMLASCISM